MNRTLAPALALIAVVLCCAARADALDQASGPRAFVLRVTNPWFPLKPGTTYVYRGTKDRRPSRDVLTVTRRTKLIEGVRTTVVRDLLFLDGKLEERTTDWYGQDKQGNVWYFGEATAELDRSGRVTSREGSWQAGVNGAKPGIYMPAHPQVGQSFRQEYYKGHAEDHFRIVSLSSSVRVPAVASHRALLTREWTPLEPGVIDRKYYVRGFGTVEELSVKGPPESAVLVSVRTG
jgi:hypothetical protein